MILVEGADNRSTFNITDNAYGAGSSISPPLRTQPGPVVQEMDVSKSGNWYDISVSHVQGDSFWRFMGRMETGEHSTSDPAMASGYAPTTLPAAGFPVGLEGHADVYHPAAHAPVPEWYRTHDSLKLDLEKACESERGRQLVKDACFQPQRTEL